MTLAIIPYIETSSLYTPEMQIRSWGAFNHAANTCKKRPSFVIDCYDKHKILLCNIGSYLKQVQIKSKVKLQVIIPNFPMGPMRYVQCVASAQGSPTAPST